MENNNENVESIETEETVNQVHHGVNDDVNDDVNDCNEVTQVSEINNNDRCYDPPDEFDPKQSIDVINKKINFIFTILATEGILFGYYMSPELMIAIVLLINIKWWIKAPPTLKIINAFIFAGSYYFSPLLTFLLFLRLSFKTIVLKQD
jgi:hypothetical protein